MVEQGLGQCYAGMVLGGKTFLKTENKVTGEIRDITNLASFRLFWLNFDSQRAPWQDLNSYLEFMETIVEGKPEAQ